jgi:tetratricopeptide (TPR) repeat protein
MNRSSKQTFQLDEVQRLPFEQPQNLSSATIQALLLTALRHYDAGQTAEAERLCLQVLSIDVRHANALYVLGMVAYKTGRFPAAAAMIRRAIAVNPQQPYYHSNLGNALCAQGKFDEAIPCFKQALDIDPNHAEAKFNLGNVFREKKEYDQASACYQQALVVKPDYVDAMCNLGIVYGLQNKLDLAAAIFERALALAPDRADLICNLADVFHTQGYPAQAVPLFERALALKPDQYKACNCLCNAFFDLGDLARSAAWNQRTLDLEPDYGEALMNKALLELLRGDYASGWRDYEVRWKVYKPRLFAQPLWSGQPLNGARILLHDEQGLGDSLQFFRYVPMVIKAGGTVVLGVPAKLSRIAALISGIELVNNNDPLPSFDFHCPLLSLPLAFGTTIETIPAQVPYLAVPDEALQKASTFSWPATGLRVGLAWSGNPKHRKNRMRSIPLALLDPLFKLEGVHFYSLQMGPAAGELKTARAAITDLSPFTGDMADTAAQIAHLDLIISIDTSIAHLAGSLGKPLWVLLTRLPDWRWLLDREDSPWYPTARLFRQSKSGDWAPVVELLRTALEELAAQRYSTQFAIK